MGSYQYPVAVGRGAGKITGKAKFAQITGRVYSDLFFGTTFDNDMFRVANAEAGVVADNTNHTIQVDEIATFVDDLGVVDALTNLPMIKIAVGAIPPPTLTATQYAVDAGIYYFHESREGDTMNISYTYTATSGGNTIEITNQKLGTTPTFMAVLQVEWDSKPLTIKLNKCVATKLSFASKLEDFMVPEFDFEAMADSLDVIGTIGTIE
jgi:hypothetical protein